MVSGFVTSPEDQSRICLLDARPIRIASKSLMSIKCFPLPSLFNFQIGQVHFPERRDGLAFPFLVAAVRRDLDVEVPERLVCREVQLARLVDALLSLLELLGGRR